MNDVTRVSRALLPLALCAFVACARPRPEPQSSPDATPPAADVGVAPESDGASSTAPNEPAPAGGAPVSNVAPGASVDVWAVAGPLERGYEPLGGEPPSWSAVWVESGRAPPPLVSDLGAPGAAAGSAPDSSIASAPGSSPGSSWIARVRSDLRVTEAGPREVQLTLSGGARVTLDGQVVLDRFTDDLRGTTKLALGELDAGEHPFELWTWGNADARELSLAWRRDEAHPWRWLAKNDWSHAASPNRAVPGLRRVKRPNVRRPGVKLEPPITPSFVVDTFHVPGLAHNAVGLASLAPQRWLVLEGGARAKVRLHVLAGDTLTPPRAFASGLDHPGGIAVSDGRVFVAQKNELTELVDRDADGVVDEYRVALELPGREFARPVGLAVDQGLAAILFETESGVKALIASLADGRTTLHDLGGAAEAFVAAGFDGAFLVLSRSLDPGCVFGHWVGLVPERSWRIAMDDSVAAFCDEVLPYDFGPFASLERDDSTARFQMGATIVAVARTADGFDLSVAQDQATRTLGWSRNDPRTPSRGSLCAAPTGDGATVFLGDDDALRRVRRAPGVSVLLGARSHPNAIELEFSAPLAFDSGWEREAWNTAWGSPAPAEWVSVSADRRRILIARRDQPPIAVTTAKPVRDELGHLLRPTAGVRHVATLVADRKPLERPPFPDGVRNVLSEEERAAGWRLLFDGKTLAGWKNYGRDEPPVGWSIDDGMLVRVADGGDLVTDELFESFELEFDWWLDPGGNGGVFFHVVDGYDYVWRTGPEYQLLDNDKHADGQNPLTSAGANYALHAPEYDDTRPIGSWNHSRLVVDGAHVEHWLNGEKQCEYELWSDDWKARVATSKFAAMPDYGLAKTGRIALQDHGDRVGFMNLKLRPIVR
ncbi:MAG: DUF1080 domain-containing protein [Planctomycetes bacterium]|nr:DUF1080 domain-containing protein [Planctomycetota bacterium]